MYITYKISLFHTLKPDHVRQEYGGPHPLHHDVQAEQEEGGVKGAVDGDIPDPRAIKHSSAAEAKAEHVEHSDHGSQGGLGVSYQFQHFESSLGNVLRVVYLLLLNNVNKEINILKFA